MESHTNFNNSLFENVLAMYCLLNIEILPSDHRHCVFLTQWFESKLIMISLYKPMTHAVRPKESIQLEVDGNWIASWKKGLY